MAKVIYGMCNYSKINHGNFNVSTVLLQLKPWAMPCFFVKKISTFYSYKDELKGSVREKLKGV